MPKRKLQPTFVTAATPPQRPVKAKPPFPIKDPELRALLEQPARRDRLVSRLLDVAFAAEFYQTRPDRVHLALWALDDDFVGWGLWTPDTPDYGGGR